MSIIVSVKIHEGVVMATDSATTFLQPDGSIGQIYANADKMVNLVKGLPIGVMTCGSANIGNAAITQLLWTQVSLILLVIIATVIVSEWVSAKVRHAII